MGEGCGNTSQSSQIPRLDGQRVQLSTLSAELMRAGFRSSLMQPKASKGSPKETNLMLSK